MVIVIHQGEGSEDAVFLGKTPGVLRKKAPRAIRAMRGKTLQTVPFKGISTVLWVHQKLPQSTVSYAFPSNESYESKAGCNRTPATVLWVPLICLGKNGGESVRIVKHYDSSETLRLQAP